MRMPMGKLRVARRRVWTLTLAGPKRGSVREKSSRLRPCILVIHARFSPPSVIYRTRYTLSSQLGFYRDRTVSSLQDWPHYHLSSALTGTGLCHMNQTLPYAQRSPSEFHASPSPLLQGERHSARRRPTDGPRQFDRVDIAANTGQLSFRGSNTPPSVLAQDGSLINRPGSVRRDAQCPPLP